jgi:hypothetical protein
MLESLQHFVSTFNGLSISLDLQTSTLVISGNQKQLAQAYERLNANSKYAPKPFEYNKHKTQISGYVWHSKDIENLKSYIDYINNQKIPVSSIEVRTSLQGRTKGMAVFEAAAATLEETIKNRITLAAIKDVPQVINMFEDEGNSNKKINVSVLTRATLVRAYDTAQTKFKEYFPDEKQYPPALAKSTMGVSMCLQEMNRNDERIKVTLR